MPEVDDRIELHGTRIQPESQVNQPDSCGSRE